MSGPQAEQTPITHPNEEIQLEDTESFLESIREGFGDSRGDVTQADIDCFNRFTRKARGIAAQK